MVLACVRALFILKVKIKTEDVSHTSQAGQHHKTVIQENLHQQVTFSIPGHS